MYDAISSGDTDFIRQYREDINARDRYGWTPLQMALAPMRRESWDERKRVLDALLDKAGFDVHQPFLLRNALTLVAGDSLLPVDALQWLVDVAKANVNQPDLLGSVAIHCALESGRGDKIEYLLSLPYLVDAEGRSAVELARSLASDGKVTADIVESLDRKVRRVLLAVSVPLVLIVSVVHAGWPCHDEPRVSLFSRY
jgi:ankyrin repeat protein